LIVAYSVSLTITVILIVSRHYHLCAALVNAKLPHMKPYYQHAGITIYHGDCREVLPSLPASGVVVTDPPYNIGYHYDGYKDNLSEDEYRELISSTVRLPSVVLHYPEDSVGISFALNELPEKCVAWTYNANTPRQWRMISWFGITPDFSRMKQPYLNQNDRRIRALMDGGSLGRDLYDWWHEEQVKNVSEEKTEHPCQIPLSVMLKICGVTHCGLVIDPFAGSGTTLAAARAHGITAIGIEIEEKYCEIAAKRLSQEVLDFSPNIVHP
jgi:DNA modification methylase